MKVFPIYRKELAYYFSSPIAYCVIGLYLLTVSLFLWVIPGEWNCFSSGYADLRGLFEVSPWLLLVLCPALTMRLIVEEKNQGTWDVLMSKHISIKTIVHAKFLAAWTLTLMAIVPCTVHYGVVYAIAEPVGNVDGGAFAGSMLGLILLSGTLTAVGLLLSSIARNQLVAFLLSLVVGFVLHWWVFLSHFESMSRGVLYLADLVFFVALTASLIVTTLFILSRQQR